MNNVVEIARSYIGKVRYQYGAKNPDTGFSDCSGFTHTVFKKAGYNIGTYTEAVWLDDKLMNVSKDELQAGDLILFKNTYDSHYVDNVSHIAIYIGDGKFIDCGSDGVHEDSLYKQYWINHYLGAKRVTGASSGVTDGVTNSSNSTSSSFANNWGLEWWGDIVVVILSVLLILAGISMLVLGVKGTVKLF